MKMYNVKIEIIKDIYLGVFAKNKKEAKEKVYDIVNSSEFVDYMSPKIHIRCNYIVKREKGDKNKWMN